MPKHFTKLSLLYVLLLSSPLIGQKLPSVNDFTQGMEKKSGFFDFYWDAQKGKIYLSIDFFEQEFLYINSLPAGLGSNDIGLDRGQLGDTRVVKFQRIGPKVLMVQPNHKYRADSDNAFERESVAQAFAQSVLWGFEVKAQTGETALVDATGFYLRDAHGVVRTLSRSKQGNYRLDASRSALYLPQSKNFPQNTEVEATLTFTGDPKGYYIRQVSPTSESVTVRQHHSFVQLPDDNYQPRVFDPRAGYFSISYQDYAAPIEDPLIKRFIARHRLQKKNPRATKSEAVEPIVYYIDRGAPQIIREAMFEGAKWWNQAFESIGYENAFQVKLLPEDADPMDVRYNLVQWVHRATRGWSYGASVRDPRTGEIIKGHVTLGSLRLRQDYLIAEGLLAPYKNGKAVPKDMKEIALARLRQLVAHEIGHTLGLVHNFAASYTNRASVMDYPHPFITVDQDGSINWSEAYDVNIGEWDKVAIAYGYSDFPEGTNEAEALNKIIQNSFDQGIRFISDADARPFGGAHPLAHLWDNGESATEELNRVMQLRQAALDNFSENNIPVGMPMASLENVLVPIYLYHRYQVEATSKLIGGLDYSYALRGDGQLVTEIIPANTQRAALQAVLATLKPEVLTLSERIIQMIPPQPPGYSRGRENFQTHTGLSFDPVSAAETATDLVLGLLLHPQRAARLCEYHARDVQNPGLGEVIEALMGQSWDPKNMQDQNPSLRNEVQKMVNFRVLEHLMQLASDQKASERVRAIAWGKLRNLKVQVNNALKQNPGEWADMYNYAQAELDLFLDNPKLKEYKRPLKAPAGSPIGWGIQCSCGGH